jgi:hypothetical protein
MITAGNTAFVLQYFSQVMLVLGYGLDDRMFESRQGLGIFFFTTASRPVGTRGSLPGDKVAGADHSPRSSAEVKDTWSSTSTHPIRLHGVVLNSSTGTNLPLPYLDQIRTGYL